MSKCDKKIEIEAAMKAAMRAKDKPRLGTIRLILADVKRIEVDERIDIDEPRLIATMDKMLKQRRDSIAQFRSAGREELAAQEELEIAVIQTFLPTQLTDDELVEMISAAISSSGAESMKDMGKVMAHLKAAAQGRADMGKISGMIKAALNS